MVESEEVPRTSQSREGNMKLRSFPLMWQGRRVVEMADPHLLMREMP